MSKYKRKYELVFGEPYTVNTESIQNSTVLSPEGKLAALEDKIRKADAGNYGYKLTDHHITFDIDKNSNGTSPNTSKIKIYNLSDEIIDFLSNTTNKKVVVILKAGYESEDLKTIFIGNMEKFEDNWETETRVTEMTLLDGGANYLEAFTNRVYKKGTPLDTIVNDLIGDLKLPKSGAMVVPSNKTIERNWYFSGNVWNQLHKLAVYYDNGFSVQDGTVFWTPIGVGLKRSVSLINSETGLIGSVSAIDNNSGISQLDSSGSPGIKFKILLDGSILPETVVKVESRSFNGFYKVSKVSHSGSYEGENWFTEIEAQEVDNLI